MSTPSDASPLKNGHNHSAVITGTADRERRTSGTNSPKMSKNSGKSDPRPALLEVQQHWQHQDYRRYHRYDRYDPNWNRHDDVDIAEQKTPKSSGQRLEKKKNIPPVAIVAVEDEHHDENSLKSLGVVSSVTESTAFHSQALPYQYLNHWKETGVLKKYEEEEDEDHSTSSHFRLLAEAKAICAAEEARAGSEHNIAGSPLTELTDESSIDRGQLLAELKEAKDFKNRAFHSDVKVFWDEKIRNLEECLQRIDKNIDEQGETKQAAEKRISNNSEKWKNNRNLHKGQKKTRQVRLQAKSNMSGGQSFTARIRGEPITLRVPRGGVRKGEVFCVPYQQSGKNVEEAARNNPHGNLILEDEHGLGGFLSPCFCASPSEWFRDNHA